MAIFKNVVATTGSYTNNQGEVKKQFTKVGVYIEQPDGRASIKIEPWFNPAGCQDKDGNVWLNIFDQDKKADNVAPVQNVGTNQQPNVPESDCPF